MKLTISYYVTFGDGDSSEDIEWDSFDLSEGEIEAIEEARENGIGLDDMEEFECYLEEAYDEIMEQEIETMREIEDPYMMDCDERGVNPFEEGCDLKVFLSCSED